MEVDSANRIATPDQERRAACFLEEHKEREKNEATLLPADLSAEAARTMKIRTAVLASVHRFLRRDVVAAVELVELIGAHALDVLLRLQL